MAYALHEDRGYRRGMACKIGWMRSRRCESDSHPGDPPAAREGFIRKIGHVTHGGVKAAVVGDMTLGKQTLLPFLKLGI